MRATMLAALLAGLGLLVLLQPESSQGAVVISRREVSNVTNSSFTISWVTNQPTTGYVRWGTNPNSRTNPQYDDRDPNNPNFISYTHFVTVSQGINAKTTYWYSIVSGDTTLPTASPTATNDSFSILTGDFLNARPNDYQNNYFTGTIFRSDGVRGYA